MEAWFRCVLFPERFLSSTNFVCEFESLWRTRMFWHLSSGHTQQKQNSTWRRVRAPPSQHQRVFVRGNVWLGMEFSISACVICGRQAFYLLTISIIRIFMAIQCLMVLWCATPFAICFHHSPESGSVVWLGVVVSSLLFCCVSTKAIPVPGLGFNFYSTQGSHTTNRGDTQLLPRQGARPPRVCVSGVAYLATDFLKANNNGARALFFYNHTPPGHARR